MSKPAIFGLVKNEAQARTAVTALEAAGFIATDISVLSNSAYFNDNGVVQEGFGKTREVAHTNSTKAPEGATAGAAAGGVLGGLAGWLIGIGALAIPGAGPFIAAGPIFSALSAAAIGATAGGLSGALVGYGIPEYEAKLYAGRLDEGHILIGVHAIDSTEAEAAKKAFESVGAQDIKETSEVVAKSSEEVKSPSW
jgi:outer membrane lipoprotein SlyB